MALATTTHIVVDQFGYLPKAEKIAVIRVPKIGFDTSDTYTPGDSYAVVDTATNKVVLSAAPVAWNSGATDEASGDQAWWFDFSAVTAPGSYVVVDKQHRVRSYEFSIADNVYRDVLKAAVRMLFYQRAGQNKSAGHAGQQWADSASHLGADQDTASRRFLDKNNPATAKDLRGGWYDAGDFNKYTSWAAGYVLGLLHAYAERPTIWADDYNIPESGNNIPDIVDEAKWGLDWLIRMQNEDGSLLSIMNLASASPPSRATAPSYYGDANTSATLKTAAAFAYASVVLKRIPNSTLSPYADDLLTRAERAWAWASKNPNVVFANNKNGMCCGEQETDDAGRLMNKFHAAVYLFAATGKSEYRDFVDGNYTEVKVVKSNWIGPWDDVENAMVLLDYATNTNATKEVATVAKSRYLQAVQTNENLNTVKVNNDPYGAYIQYYTWGSNATKCRQGMLDYFVATYGLDKGLEADATRAAARYVHYLHGVNPMQLVYLTNTKSLGAENHINEIYHTWFTDGSKWDRAPAPGYLSGGPNPSYGPADCCKDLSCNTNNVCSSLKPPMGQPAAKSYKDFNANWPGNSWSVTEPSNGYQIAYINLLSKYVP